VLGEIGMSLERELPALPRPDAQALLRDPSTALLRCLQALAARAARPLVVLLDEADGLVGEAVVSFLTQLRRGYIERAQVPFPHALALVGMREVRDYVISNQERYAVAWLGTTSPFNITAETVTLRMFTREEVDELLLQHTAATGQRFEPGALDLVLEWHGARYAVEVKLRRDSETEQDAFEQLARYLDTLGFGEGWLVLFDLRSTAPWQQRLLLREAEHDGKRIHVVGC
jgi:hypothetical protein